MLRSILLAATLSGTIGSAVANNNGIIDKTATPEKEISLTLKETLLMTLEGNTNLKVRRIQPQIQNDRDNVSIQKAAFDPKLSAGLDYTVDRAHKTDDARRSAQDISMDATLSKKLKTGTKVELGVDLKRDETTDTDSDNKNHKDSLGLELKITQSLLEGRGSDVTLAGIRRAEISTEISKHQLRRYVETLVYNVSNAYWDLVLKKEQLSIYQESYEIAQKRQREVEILIENGKVAEIEEAIVKGEVSSRKEQLITAQGDINKRRLNLLNFVNYAQLTPQAWSTEITPTDSPDTQLKQVDDVNKYVDIAIKKRPEIKEAELKIEREEVDLVVTKNGLLPKLDFFVSLGRTHYANSFRSGSDTLSNDTTVKLGLDLSMDLGGRADKERHQRNLLEHQKEIYAMANLERLISLEVRKAYIDCKTGLETISAVKITTDLRRQSLETQAIKFELGKATNLDIANSQRDLLSSQIKYTQAMISYVKARIKLHYLDGSLIERFGLDVAL